MRKREREDSDKPAVWDSGQRGLPPLLPHGDCRDLLAQHPPLRLVGPILHSVHSCTLCTHTAHSCTLCNSLHDHADCSLFPSPSPPSFFRVYPWASFETANHMAPNDTTQTLAQTLALAQNTPLRALLLHAPCTIALLPSILLTSNLLLLLLLPLAFLLPRFPCVPSDSYYSNTSLSRAFPLQKTKNAF